MRVRAYRVWVRGHERHAATVNAASRGKAKYEQWLEISDMWTDLPFTAMRAQVAGPPRGDAMFEHVARLRGLPGVRCGHRVRHGADEGTIVGASSGALFKVLFDEGEGKFSGLSLACHPAELEFLEEDLFQGLKEILRIAEGKEG